MLEDGPVDGYLEPMLHDPSSDVHQAQARTPDLSSINGPENDESPLYPSDMPGLDEMEALPAPPAIEDGPRNGPRDKRNRGPRKAKKEGGYSALQWQRYLEKRHGRCMSLYASIHIKCCCCFFAIPFPSMEALAYSPMQTHAPHARTHIPDQFRRTARDKCHSYTMTSPTQLPPTPLRAQVRVWMQGGSGPSKPPSGA